MKDLSKEMKHIHQEMKKMHQNMDRLFSHFFRTHKHPLLNLDVMPPAVIKKDAKLPEYDIKETKDLVTATVELPGVNKKNINVNITNNSIEVSVSEKSEKETRKKGSYSFHGTAKQFYRSIPLYNEVDSSKAKAEYKDGVLAINIPKLKSKKRLMVK